MLPIIKAHIFKSRLSKDSSIMFDVNVQGTGKNYTYTLLADRNFALSVAEPGEWPGGPPPLIFRLK